MALTSQQHIAQLTSARIAAQKKRDQAAAQRLQARQARQNAINLKKQQKQDLKNAYNNSIINPVTPQNPSDQLQGIMSQQSSSSLNTPDQSMVPGGYGGTNVGTNDTGGITLGNGTGDTTTPPQTTGLTTTEYVAIGIVIVVVIFMVARHKAAATG